MHRPSDDQVVHRRLAAAAAVAVLALVALAAVLRVQGAGSADPPPDPGRATAPAAADGTPPDETPEAAGPAPTAPPPPSTTTPTGRFASSSVTGAVVGQGPLRTYRVEVEEGTGVDVDRFADEVEVILSSEWGWTTADGLSLQRVGGEADIVVTLATPPTVDLLCYPLRTHSEVSCAQGQRAVLNLERWLHGAEPSGLEVAAYRGYLVSHEVGHTLGHGHVECPAPGAPAPVMMQQTYGIGDCAPNPWPVPVDTTG